MIGSSVPSELSKTSELFPLSKNYQLYLKPLARVSLTVQIPTLHDASGQTKSFTTWGIIEKLRQLCPGVLSPPTPIKVVRTTLEFVRFIAELETKAEVKRVVTSLDSQFIKLSGFPQNLRVRASEAQTDCPRRHDWESFFRDASNMDETQPGERPDTLVLTGLPVRWFVNPVAKSSSHINGTGSSAENYSSKSDRPCLDVLRSVFETFGPIRNVDIPMLDPVQNPHCVDEFINEICGMKIKTDESHSSTATPTDDRDAPLGFVSQDREIGGFGKICPDTISIMGRPSTYVLAKARKSVIDDALGPIDTVDGDSNSQTPSVGSLTFVAYVQYMDYTGFSRAMEGLRGQKLVYAPTSCERHSAESTDTRLYFTAEIKVDFDRSKHLSRPAIQTRQVERNRLITVANRRLAEAEAEAAQIAKQQRMLEDAKRKENERIRMEALAREAEREARRAARLERKKQRAIERCKQEKDALVRQKITLDERRRLLAVRKLEAIRLVTFLIARIQSRHDEIVSAKREARVARAEREAAEAEARLAQQAAVAISTAAHPRPMVSPKRSSSALNESDLCDPREDETERLRQHLLAKMLRRREEMLRAALLEKHAEAEHVQNFNRRSSNEVSSSTVTKRRRSPVHS